MATSLKNLSEYDPKKMPDADDFRVGIVVAEWNQEVTNSLCEGACQTLVNNGVKEENIAISYVPGTFELTLGAQLMAENATVDAVIVLGCVIQGETRHFDFICQGVTQGITDLNIKYNMPFIFGVLTTDNQRQALERAGGKHGNKGDEAAYTAIKMIDLQKKLKSGIA
jgi:6,7-dimethyl-8-ribityllumazine synthase